MYKRKLNYDGYILVFKPNHPRAYNAGGYKGWVYEHILVCERKIKRKLKMTEEVHHFDGIKSNNSPENLIPVTSEQHHFIHAWLNKGAPFKNKILIKEDYFYDHKKEYPLKRCLHCQFPLYERQNNYCSMQCYNSKLNLKKPSKERLLSLLKDNKSWVDLGKIFGVSDNGVRKWARKLGINPKNFKYGKKKNKRFVLKLNNKQI